MSQNKTFEDFLRWKKDQQTRGGGGGRRYRDDSSDTDSSVEEVKFSKRNVNKKKYYEESDTSSSSSDEYPSRRKKQTIKSERGGDKYRSSNNRGNSSDRERERGKSSRSGRNGGRERERERERERGKSSKSSRNERYRDSSDEEDEIRIVNKRGTLKGRSTKTSSSSTRRNVPKHKRPTDNRISSDSDSSDDQDRRYRRNVDSSDSEEIKIRKRKPITSKSRRSKSEHIQKKPINKKRVDSSDDESPRRNKSSKTPTVSKGRKIQHKKPVDTETSSDDEQQHRINHKKETSSSKKKPNIKQINNEHSHPKKEKFQIKKVEEDERDSSSSSSSDDNDEIEKPKKPTISTKNKTNHHTSEKKNTSDIHFEHNLWMEKWEKVFSSQDKDAKKKRSQLKELLQQIDHLTDRVCDGSNFIVSERSGQDVNDKSYNLSSFDIASAVKKTRLYSYHNVEKHLPKEGVKGPTKTTAHFIKSDIIDVGLFIKKEIRKNPLILMMGDPRTPGGEKHRCLFGEEIAIWRRTAIREYLEDDRRGKYFNKGEKDTFVYDIPQNGAVYCPDVPVFRSKQSKGYGFNAPETLSFVIVPPIMKPNLVNGRLTEEDIEIVRKKINMIFLVALENNHDAVVVTAFGCGYAQNPPKHIAEILTEAIAKFKHYFSNIAFAIVDNANARKNSPEGNIAPFSNVFSTVLKKHSPQENVN